MTSDRHTPLSSAAFSGGRINKRASLILFLIENRTAHLVVQSRQVVAPFVAEKAAEKRESALLDELAQVRELPVQPTIQDLERFAPQWEHVVPRDPLVRAVLAHLLGEKYIFTHGAVPLLRRAIALDDKLVKQAYQIRYDQPLANIFAPAVSRLERLRWVWTRLAYRIDNLPPFWLVFGLTLTEAVGSTILALPIALAGMGVLAGVAQIIVLGVVNMLTIAALAEAIARDGNVRYGSAFFGRLVSDYLGSAGNFILTLTLLVLSITVLMVYGVGISTSLADATGIHPIAWLVPLLLVVLYSLIRQTFSETVASSLVLGGVNITLILILALLVLPHVTASNLTFINLPWGIHRPFDASALTLAFGVILCAYLGHTSTVGSARLVLHRDPSGRSLIGGAMAAMAVAMVINCVWVVVVNGAIAPALLAAQTGTGLAVLANQAGPLVSVFGLPFVVLSMGSSTLSFSSALFNQVQEWLPESAARKPKPPKPLGGLSRLRELALSNLGRLVIGVAPVVLVFMGTGWMLATHQQSFSDSLSFLGTLAVPLLGGVFPILLLVAGRRKGDRVPATMIAWLGHPLVSVGIYALFLFSILGYGVVIWQDPLERLAALAVGAAILGMTALVARRGAFTPRAVIEVRVEKNPEEQFFFNVAVNGKPLPAEVVLKYDQREQTMRAASGEFSFGQLRSAAFQLRAANACELKVWVHRATREAESVALPARVTLQSNEGPVSCELVNRQVVLPIKKRDWRLAVEFEQAPKREAVLDQI